jgi:hypothetical protein
MPSLSNKFRAVAVVAALAAGANLGVAAASAKTETHHKNTKHHVQKHKTHKKHATKKHATKKVVAQAASANKTSSRPKPTKPTKPSKPVTLTTTTPTTTTPTTTTPTTTTPTTTTPTTTTPTGTTAPPVTPASSGPVGIPGNWNVVLDSEFNGASLNSGTSTTWQTGWFGSGVTSPVNSSEADCYSPSNVTFPGDGTMHLAVTNVSSTCGGVTKPYTGALVDTNPSDGHGTGFQYTYGVLEARVYVPASGTSIANWPAVWTDGQSWPADGEDDVMEGLGGAACYHFHDPLGGPGSCTSTISPGWHTFASDWQPGSVTYYYDGVDVGSITTGITTAPMYLLLDDTVAGGATAVPDAMQVQYVRVWQS